VNASAETPSPDKKKVVDFNDAHKKKKDFLDQINNMDETF